MADIRTGRPGAADERDGGDGAAAFVFGERDVAAEIVAQTSITAEFLDRWRMPGEVFSRVWEERFGLELYLPLIRHAAARTLAAAELERVDHVIVSSPHTRAAKLARRELAAVANGGGASGHPDTLAAVGFAGAADAGLALADVLDREPPRRPDPARPAAPPSARGQRWKFAFAGSRCEGCGAVHLPPQRICVRCGAVDRMATEPMADREATIATFTVDRLAYSLAPPVIDVVLNFEGAGRFQCEMADADPNQIAIGDRVAMTFRRLFTADGVHNYFWKARPIRG